MDISTPISCVVSRSPAMSSSNSWFSKLNETGWLKNIQLLLATAVAIAKTMNKGNPVLVHGDSGCDTELQLTSLVQIMMDPHCRTVKGWESCDELCMPLHTVDYPVQYMCNEIED